MSTHHLPGAATRTCLLTPASSLGHSDTEGSQPQPEGGEGGEGELGGGSGGGMEGREGGEKRKHVTRYGAYKPLS